jgi:branched-subunit amino acid aminotransferase/4-amino-4-deoxychorismate lyase
MIWSEGRIIPDDALSISVLDRTFEHGLGLFETLRTWGGRPTLLEQHKARMLRSAGELMIPIDPATLPDDAAVRTLLDAEGSDGDRMLRITATGGSASGPSIVWMRSAPLPAPTREGGAIVCVNAWSLPIYPSKPGEPMRRGALVPIGWNIDEDDEVGPIHPPDLFTARHKTLNYWARRTAFEQAKAAGYDEILFMDDNWGLTEGSRSSLYLVIDETLIVRPDWAPIVPGIMGRLVVEVAGELPIKTREMRELGRDELISASEVFLTNAVRGIIPVARFEAPLERLEWPAPGPWTGRLQELVARRLWPDRGGTTP